MRVVLKPGDRHAPHNDRCYVIRRGANPHYLWAWSRARQRVVPVEIRRATACGISWRHFWAEEHDEVDDG